MDPPAEWELHVLALAYYRAGQYHTVAELLSEVLKARPDTPNYVMARNWLLMAITEQRLGHAQKAQTWFDKADLWIKEETPKMNQPEHLSAQPRLWWGERLMIQLLHREAEALIRGKNADHEPQKKSDKNDAKG